MYTRGSNKDRTIRREQKYLINKNIKIKKSSIDIVFSATVAVYLADISSLVERLLVHRFQGFDHTRQIHQLAGQRNAIYPYDTMTTISCRGKRHVFETIHNTNI